MDEKTILLVIEYDGTEFSGWQRQPEARTVQGTLEEALTRLCRVPVQIDGTGRTDAGVHALGQCATFRGAFGIPVEKMQTAANAILAESRQKAGAIRIREVREVPENFHARFSAAGKTYLYRLYLGGEMPVFLRNYRYQIRKPLDVRAMRRAARAFEGSHDFAAFMSQGSTPQVTTVRRIVGMNLEQDGPELLLSVTGDGFLYNMVRIITGTLVDVGLGRLDAERVPDIIDSRDRQRAGHTAPPQGLFMAEVYFSEEAMARGAKASRL